MTHTFILNGLSVKVLANSASGIITSGGGFTFNPLPTAGESINTSTGEITGGLAGNTYNVEYLTNGTCPQQSVRVSLC